MQDIRITAGSSTNLPFLMVDEMDHVTPVVDLSPTVYVSQVGGDFFLPINSVVEIGNGWYQLDGSSDLSGFIGPLILHAEAPGADHADARYEVVAAPGLAPLVRGSGRYPLTFLMVQSTDHLTGAYEASPSVTIAKVGGSFATPFGTIYEIKPPPHIPHGFGWYGVTPDARNYDIAGPLLLHAVASGCDITDERYDIAGVDANPQYALTNSLLAIQALIINSGLFTSNNCIVSFAREPFPNPAPPCCAISYRGFAFDQGYATGGGRYLTEPEGEFLVRFIVRHASDVAQQDLLFLTNAARGSMPLVEQVVNILNEQFLFDPYGTQLTSCGLKPTSIGGPEPYSRDPLIGQIQVSLKARVMMQLDLPDP